MRNEKFDFAGFKKIQFSETGKFGNVVIVVAGVLLLVSAIVGIGTIFGWLENKFF